MHGEDIGRQRKERDKTLVGWAPIALPEEFPPIEGGVRGYRLGVRLSDSGEIYEGHHSRMSAPFVIKLFRRSTGESSDAVKAFSKEAGRMSILRHPNIAQVHDSGIFADRTPFLAMDRLVGRTLDERMAQLGPLPVDQVYAVVRGIALALSAAHTAGVIHREIRPDNIFVGERSDAEIDAVKVLDFGVSRLTWGRHSAGQGISINAERYLAPEQKRGGLENIDASVDQFALAALTHQLLAEGRSASLLVGSRAGSPVEVVLRKALGKQQSDRFPSIGRFVHAVEEALLKQGVGVSISSITPAVGAARKAFPIRKDITYRNKDWSKKVSEGAKARAKAPKNGGAERSPPNSEAAAIEMDSGFVSERVPRRRAPLVAAVILAMVATGFAARAQGWRPPHVWREFNIPFAAFVLGSKSLPRSAVRLTPPADSVVAR